MTNIDEQLAIGISVVDYFGKKGIIVDIRTFKYEGQPDVVE